MCLICKSVGIPRRSRRGFAGKAWLGWPVWPGDAGLVFGIEIRSHRGDLTKLELCEAQTTLALRRAHESTEHQFEHGLFAEAVRHDLEPPSLLDKRAFQKVRGSSGPAMSDRQPQMS